MGTYDGLVAVVGGLPPEVLPVVRVDAQRLVVLGEVEGAEHRLVREDVEVVVEHQVVDELDQDLVLGVREGAVLLVVAGLDVVRVVRAELCLVCVGPVELLRVEKFTSTLECASMQSSPEGHFLPSSTNLQSCWL